MKMHLKIATSAGVVVALLVAAVFGYILIKEAARPAETGEETRALLVKVVPVKLGKIERTLTLTGSVEPQQAADIMPKVSGRLERLALKDGTPVDIGVVVTKDEIIAEIDRAAYEARVMQAEAALKTAKAALAKAGADLADKEKEKDRMVKLYEDGKGPATEQQRDNAAADYNRALAARDMASAQIDQAVAFLKAARVDLDETFLKATISGIVTRKYVDEGTMAGPGVPIVRIINQERVKIAVGIPGQYQELLKAGETGVKVSFEGLEGVKRAKITRISQEHSVPTRTIPVEIWIDNECKDEGASRTYRYQAGMYATVKLALEQHKNAVVVPSDSLIRREEKYYAFIVNGKFCKRVEVKTGIRSGEYVEILSGHGKGDNLVVTGQHRLTDRAEVKVLRNNNHDE